MLKTKVKKISKIQEHKVIITLEKDDGEITEVTILLKNVR